MSFHKISLDKIIMYLLPIIDRTKFGKREVGRLLIYLEISTNPEYKTVFSHKLIC